MSRFLQNAYFSPSPTQSTPGGDQSSGPGSCSLFSKPFSLFHDNIALTPSQPSFIMIPTQINEDVEYQNDHQQENAKNSSQQQLPNDQVSKTQQQLHQQETSFFIKKKQSTSRKYQRKYPLPPAQQNDTHYTLDKPQRHFEDSVDNIAGTPFIPKMPIYKRKRGIGGLMEFMTQGYNNNENNLTLQKHPYQDEIDQLSQDVFNSQIELLKQQFQQKYSNQQQQQLVLIDNKSQLDSLILELSEHQIMFLDYLEHTFRSYYGFICWLIIQAPLKNCKQQSFINNEQESYTYIVDCIKLRTHLIDLIKITSNPQILKVIPQQNQQNFNITFLQRDFGLYLINAFEGLQGFKNEQQNLQKHDLRIRPFDSLAYKNIMSEFKLIDLTTIDKNQEYITNKKISSQRYSKIELSKLNDLNQNSLKYQLLKWRDDISRLEDESLEYTLPEQLLQKFVEQSSKIYSQADIVQISKDTLNEYIPILIEQNLELLLSIILQYKPTFLEDIKSPQQEEIQVKHEKTNQIIQETQQELLLSSPDPIKNNVVEKNLSKYNLSGTSSKSNYEPNMFKALNWSTTKHIPTTHAVDLATPERQYHKIITQKHFTPSFFFDSIDNAKKTQNLLNSTQSRSNRLNVFTSDTKQNSQLNMNTCEKQSQHLQMSADDSASSFKLNKDPCLNIFNRIKCFNDQERISSPEHRKYFSSLEMINERDEETIRQLRVKQQSHSTKDLQQDEYDRIALEEGAPETLKDIFKISNRNRKRNKQKKKNKGGQINGDISSDCQSDSSSISNNGNNNNISGRDRENAFSIIMNQYKQDVNEGKTNCRDFKGTVNDIKQLDDLEFMKVIGMIDDIKLQELSQRQDYNNYNYSYSSQSTQSSNQSSYNNNYYSQTQNSYNNYQRKVFQPQQQNYQNNNSNYNSQQTYNNNSNKSYSYNSSNNNNNNNNQNAAPFKKSPISFQKQSPNFSNGYNNNNSYNNHTYNRQASYNQNNYKQTPNNNTMIYSPKDQIKKR